MFGAFRPSHVNLGGLLWSVYVPDPYSLLKSLQENTVEIVTHPKGKCSIATKES
jgi:hypothetical protein